MASEDEGDFGMEREGRSQSDQDPSIVQRRRGRPPAAPPAWMPSNRPPQHLPYGGQGGYMPGAGNAPPSLPPFYELALLQQKMAFQEEQSRMQMMSQAAASFERMRTRRLPSYDAMNTADIAEERLRKKRRVEVTHPLLIEKQKGVSSTFPLPPLEGNGSNPIIRSLEGFRPTYEKFVARSRTLFQDDVDKQKEYAALRVRASLLRLPPVGETDSQSK